MRTRRVGTTALETTVLGFGGAPVGNYGVALSDTDAERAITDAWDSGVRYFDTAPLYGLGISERRIGGFLSTKNRDDYVLSTKVGRRVVATGDPSTVQAEVLGFHVTDDREMVWDFSADGIRRSVAESLERLGLDRIDIAYLHDPDDHVDQALT